MDYVPKTYITLTHDQKMDAGREIVGAALTVLCECPCEDDSDVICRFAVKALLASKRAIEGVYDRLTKSLVANKDTHALDRDLATPATYTATAFYLWMIDGDVDNCHPESIGGCQLAAFARSMIIADHMSQIVDLMDDADFVGYEAANLPLEDGFFDR